MAIIKNDSELKLIQFAASVVAKILQKIKKTIKPGITGKDLETIALKIIEEHDCQPNFLGYEGFPAAICVSRNDELIHGIPNDKPFHPGDLISVDVGCQFKNFHADAAISVGIPPINPATAKILNVTNECLTKVIEQIKPGMEIRKIGTIIETIAQKNGFSLSTEYCGHGIGHQLHENPNIYNTTKEYGRNKKKLVPGMVFCVEPMLLAGKSKTKLDQDHWTVRSVDHQINCHMEHMLLMTKHGVKVLTTNERFINN